MTDDTIIRVNLSYSSIAIIGIPTKYSWREELSYMRIKDSMKGYARVNPYDLTHIFIIKDGREIRVDALQPAKIENCILVLQDDFWGKRWGRLHRAGKKSRKFNEKQPWIDVLIPFVNFVSLAKSR